MISMVPMIPMIPSFPAETKINGIVDLAYSPHSVVHKRW
jgi:hypothetical protein